VVEYVAGNRKEAQQYRGLIHDGDNAVDNWKKAPISDDKNNAVDNPKKAPISDDIVEDRKMPPKTKFVPKPDKTTTIDDKSTLQANYASLIQQKVDLQMFGWIQPGSEEAQQLDDLQSAIFILENQDKEANQALGQIRLNKELGLEKELENVTSEIAKLEKEDKEVEELASKKTGEAPTSLQQVESQFQSKTEHLLKKKEKQTQLKRVVGNTSQKMDASEGRTAKDITVKPDLHKEEKESNVETSVIPPNKEDKEKQSNRPPIVETVQSDTDFEDESDDNEQQKILNSLCRQAEKKHGPRKQVKKREVLL
jgi:hypothetical protein